jgi:hypothetical protein
MRYPMDNLTAVNQLESAIERGKVRGYATDVVTNNINFYTQYAIKKVCNDYLSYYFFIDNKKMDAPEDDAFEETLQFKSLADALAYLQSKNAELGKFASFKGCLPF